MTEKDIQKISEQYKDEKAPLYDKIHERVEEMIVQQAQRRKRLNTFCKVFPASLAVVLIICLAIVLPIVLQPTGEQTGDNVIRYSDNQLVRDKLDVNLKDYAINNNQKYLYIDMYDVAEELITFRYYDEKDDSSTGYLQESFEHIELECSITLSIMKQNITVDKFDNFLSNAKTEKINSVEITYTLTTLDCKAQFEYGDYKYYLKLEGDIELEDLENIINNMFRTERVAA